MSTTTEATGRPGFNNALVVLPSSGYTTDQAVTIKNLVARGIQVILDVTAKTSTPTSITVTIYGVDPASGKKYTLLAGAAVTGTGTVVYRVFPGATAATNLAANDFLPHDVEIDVVGSGVDGTHFFTYSIGAQLSR